MHSKPPDRKGFLAAALGISLLVNAILIYKWSREPGNDSLAVLAQPSGTKSTINERQQVTVPPKANDAAFELNWESLAGVEFRALNQKLTELGCPEHTRKSILEVVIHLKYQPELRELFSEQAGDFWESAVTEKTARKPTRTAQQEEAREKFEVLNRERGLLLDELVERDRWRRSNKSFQSLLDSGGKDSKLAFLTEEKRDRLIEQEKKYSALLQDLRSQGMGEEGMNAALKKLKSEQEAGQEQFLTGEERDEYRARSSRYAHVIGNLYGFNPSPLEARAIVQLKERYEDKVPEEEYRTLLGSDRFEQFQRAQQGDYHNIYKVVAHLGLNEDRAITIHELKLQTEKAAQAARLDTALSYEQRRETIKQLQSQAEEGLKLQLGQTGLEMYRRKGGWWVEQLAQQED